MSANSRSRVNVSLIAMELESLSSAPEVLRSSAARSINLHANSIKSLAVVPDFVEDGDPTSVQSMTGQVLAALAYPSLQELNLSSNMLCAATPPSALHVSYLSLCPSLTYLDISANNLTDLSILCLLPSLTKLVAAHNKISNLSSLTAIPSLTALDVRSNNLSTPASLLPISSLPALKSLVFQSQDGSTNPICAHPSYVSTVLAAAPLLQSLDNRSAPLDVGFVAVDDDSSFDPKVFDVLDEDVPDLGEISDVSAVESPSPQPTPKIDAAIASHKARSPGSPPVELRRIDRLENQMRLLAAIAGEQVEATAALLTQKSSTASPNPESEDVPTPQVEVEIATSGTQTLTSATTPRGTQTNLAPIKHAITQTPPLAPPPVPPPSRRQIGALLIMQLASTTSRNMSVASLRRSLSIWRKSTSDSACIEAVRVARRSGAVTAAAALESRVRDAVTKQKDANQNDLNQLRSELTARDKVIEERDSALAKARADVDDLKSKLAILTASATESSRARDAAEDRAREALRAASKAEDERHRAEDDRVAIAKDQARTEAERFAAITKVADLTAQLDVMSSALETERVKSRSLADELDAAAEESASLKSKASAHHNEVERLQNTVSTLETKSKSKIGQLKSAFEDCARRAATDKARAARAMTAGKEAAKLVAAQRSEIQRLNDAASRRSLEEGEHLTKLQQKEEHIKALEAAIEEIRSKQDKLGVALRVKDVTISEQNREISSHTAVLDGYKEREKRMKDDLERIRGQRADLEDELDAKVDEIDELEKEVRNLKVTLEENEGRMGNVAKKEAESGLMREELEAEINDLRDIIKVKEDAVIAVEGELVDGREKMAREFASEVRAMRERMDVERETWKREREEEREGAVKIKRRIDEEARRAEKYKRRAEGLAQAMRTVEGERDAEKENVSELKRAIENYKEKAQRMLGSVFEA